MEVKKIWLVRVGGFYKVFLSCGSFDISYNWLLWILSFLGFWRKIKVMVVVFGMLYDYIRFLVYIF